MVLLRRAERALGEDPLTHLVVVVEYLYRSEVGVDNDVEQSVEQEADAPGAGRGNGPSVRGRGPSRSPCCAHRDDQRSLRNAPISESSRTARVLVDLHRGYDRTCGFRSDRAWVVGAARAPRRARAGRLAELIELRFGRREVDPYERVRPFEVFRHVGDGKVVRLDNSVSIHPGLAMPMYSPINAG